VAKDRSSTEGRASAYDVYAKPLTAYVARFIGGQNVLGGRVSAVSNGMIVLDLPTHGRVEFVRRRRQVRPSTSPCVVTASIGETEAG
jgi:ABC-type Fe3+/spermidine/putrescine transport system ATPase subunit